MNTQTLSLRWWKGRHLLSTFFHNVQKPKWQTQKTIQIIKSKANWMNSGTEKRKKREKMVPAKFYQNRKFECAITYVNEVIPNWMCHERFQVHFYHCVTHRETIYVDYYVYASDFIFFFFLEMFLNSIPYHTPTTITIKAI